MRYVKYILQFMTVLVLSYLVSNFAIYLIFGEWDFGNRSGIVECIIIVSVIAGSTIYRNRKAKRDSE